MVINCMELYKRKIENIVMRSEKRTKENVFVLIYYVPGQQFVSIIKPQTTSVLLSTSSSFHECTLCDAMYELYQQIKVVPQKK